MSVCTPLFILGNSDDDCLFVACIGDRLMMTMMMSCLSVTNGWLIIARPSSTRVGYMWVGWFLLICLGLSLVVGDRRPSPPAFSYPLLYHPSLPHSKSTPHIPSDHQLNNTSFS